MKQSTMHFKMTNGEEVICQVIDWAEDTEDDYIVKNALNVVQTTISEKHTRYMFKPWFTMAEKSDQYICISKDHIVACTLPNDTLFTEYRRAINQMISSSKKRPTPTLDSISSEELFLREKNEYDQVQKEILELIEEMERRSNEEIEIEELSGDSSGPSNNIIKFPGPDSIH